MSVCHSYFTQDLFIDLFIRSSNLIIYESYFLSDGKFYKQINSLPMGLSISGIIAEFKLRDLEAKIMTNQNGKIG